MEKYDFFDDNYTDYDMLFDHDDFEDIMDSLDINLDLDLEDSENSNVFEDMSGDMYNA